jgi:hypothetical protein
MMGAAAVGAGGLVLTFIGIAINPEKAWSSYLLAFCYWTGLAMTSLMMVAIFNTAAAKWITVLRRQLENHASALLVCAVAFIPLLFGMKHLYLWANEEKVKTLAEHTQHLLHHKQPYLNTQAFAIRAAIYFAIFIGTWFFISRNSRKQETMPPDLALRSRTRGLSAGMLPFLALSITFGAFDWLMSMEPEWFSAIFGAYYFAGAFVSSFALLMLTTIVPTDPNLHGAKTSTQHVANLGALMFAFSCFWAYMGFSQYIIIWHANIPEETSWLFNRGLGNLARFHRGIDPPTSHSQWSPVGAAWFPVTALLIIGRFALPFLTLLSHNLKRNRRFLTAMAVWILTMEFVDLFWVIKPALRLLNPDLAMPESGFAWTDVTAWLGLGGICVAFVIWRMRGANAVPVNDPTLEYSVHYQQPMA